MAERLTLDLEKRKIFRKTRTSSANGGVSQSSSRDRMSLEQIIREAGGHVASTGSQRVPHNVSGRGVSVDTTIEGPHPATVDPLVMISQNSVLPSHTEKRKLVAPVAAGGARNGSYPSRNNMLSSSNILSSVSLPFAQPQTAEEVHANAVAEAAATLSLALGATAAGTPNNTRSKSATSRDHHSITAITNRGATPHRDRGDVLLSHKAATQRHQNHHHRHVDPLSHNVQAIDPVGGREGGRTPRGSSPPSPRNQERYSDPHVPQSREHSIVQVVAAPPSPTKPKATLKYVSRVEGELQSLQTRHGELCALLLTTAQEKQVLELAHRENLVREADILLAERDAREVLGMWFHSTLRVITTAQIDSLRRDISTAFSELDKSVKQQARLEAKLEETYREKENILLGAGSSMANGSGAIMNTPRRGGTLTNSSIIGGHSNTAIGATEASFMQQQQTVNNTALNAATIAVVVNDAIVTHHKHFEKDFMRSFGEQIRQLEEGLQSTTERVLVSRETHGIDERESAKHLEATLSATGKAVGDRVEALIGGLKTQIEAMTQSIAENNKNFGARKDEDMKGLFEAAIAKQGSALTDGLKDLTTRMDALAQQLSQHLSSQSTAKSPQQALSEGITVPSMEALLERHSSNIISATMKSFATASADTFSQKLPKDLQILERQMELLKEENQNQLVAMKQLMNQQFAALGGLIADHSSTVKSSLFAMGGQLQGLEAASVGVAKNRQAIDLQTETDAQREAKLATVVKDAVAAATKIYHAEYRLLQKSSLQWLEAYTSLTNDSAEVRQRLFSDSMLAVALASCAAAPAIGLPRPIEYKATSIHTLPSHNASTSTPPHLSTNTIRNFSSIPPVGAASTSIPIDLISGASRAGGSITAMPKEASLSEPFPLHARAIPITGASVAPTKKPKATNNFDDSSDEEEVVTPQKISPQHQAMPVSTTSKPLSLLTSPANMSMTPKTTTPNVQLGQPPIPAAKSRNSMDSSSDEEGAKPTNPNLDKIANKRSKSSSSSGSVNLELSLSSSLSGTKSLSRRKSSLDKNNYGAKASAVRGNTAKPSGRQSSDSDSPSAPRAKATSGAGGKFVKVDQRLDSSSSSDGTPARGNTVLFGHNDALHTSKFAPSQPVADISSRRESDSMFELRLAPLPIPGGGSDGAAPIPVKQPAVATSLTSPVVVQAPPTIDPAAEAAKKKAELEARRRKLFGFDEDEVGADNVQRGPSVGSAVRTDSSIGTPRFTDFAPAQSQEQTPPILSLATAASARPTTSTYFGMDSPLSFPMGGHPSRGNGIGVVLGGKQTSKSDGESSSQQLSSLSGVPVAVLGSESVSTSSHKAQTKKKTLPTW